MEYKNIKTGTVIDSPSIIIGKAWELIEEKQTESNSAPKKTTRKTKE